MLRLCICLMAMSLIGCQCPVKEVSGVGNQESEPQTLVTVPSSESKETVAEAVQPKPVSTQVEPNPGKITSIQWISSFDEGLKIARAKNCPLMVDFSAEWCGWCKKLDEDTWTNKDVILLAQKFVCVKIDCDTDRQTPARYGARSLPTILFINPEAKVIHQVIGYRNPEDMIVEMNKAGGQ